TSHFPVPHSAIVDQLHDAMDASGYDVVTEQYGIKREGAQMFGLIQVQPKEVTGELILDEADPGISWPRQRSADDDYGLVIGVRNSHDKTFPAALTLGSGVFV